MENYEFQTMRPLEVREYPNADYRRLSAAASAAGKRWGWTFKTARSETGGYVWRVK